MRIVYRVGDDFPDGSIGSAESASSRQYETQRFSIEVSPETVVFFRKVLDDLENLAPVES